MFHVLSKCELIAELKYPELEPQRRKEVLEQMESILADLGQDCDSPG